MYIQLYVDAILAAFCNVKGYNCFAQTNSGQIILNSGGNMKTVARFEKVSYEQFRKDLLSYNLYEEDKIKEIYNNIKLPERATKDSAGYDFFVPVDIKLMPESMTGLPVPTGIRCKMDEDVVLMLYPRSGLGFKYGMALLNTVGVIDSDYYNADNEGHIKLKISNPSNKTLELKAGSAIMQGIFTPYYLAEESTPTAERTGGFGSTDTTR